MAEEKKIIEGPAAIKKPTLKEIYETTKAPRDKPKEIGTGRGLTVKSKVPTSAPLPITSSPFPKVVAPAGKTKEFKLAGGGYPDGVPPGAAKSVPSWDYDQASGKYMSGRVKEAARRNLWDRYRAMQRNRGTRSSTMGRRITNRPTVAGLKYGG